MKPKKIKKLKETVLDKAFSLFIRNRDGSCLRCGSKNNLQCAHVFSRNMRSVRWYPLNAITLCFKCHFGWAHKCPTEFTELIKIRLGEADYTLLRVEAHRIKKWTDEEKKVLLSSFQQVKKVV